jgi:chromosome segregation protein
VRRAELEGELAAERRQLERRERESALRAERVQRIRAQLAVDLAAVPLGERLCAALLAAREAVESQIAALEDLLAGERLAGEEMAGELRACAAREAELQGALRAAGERVTDAEVAAQRARDRAAEAELELEDLDTSLGRPGASDEHGESPSEEALPEERKQELTARLERLARRREQLGPVNPLAQSEYADARAHVEELEEQRADLETALRELRAVIRETDRQIERTFEETFAAAARNFEELAGDVFPGGSGRLRLVREERAPRAVLGGQALAEEQAAEGSADGGEDAADAELEAELRSREGEEELPGVEIEITPAGKSTKRLSLLSGGEKSMTALAFVFAVFLARPCPFYILDEVEAALDDANLDRFLALLRRYSQRAQFVVITHQKRTMEAADWLYGVSMGGDGVSKVLSRKLPAAESSEQFAADSAEQDVAQVA